MSLGRVFQNVEAATENERRPTVDRRYGGTSSCCVNDDRNRRWPGRFDSMLFLSATPQFDSVIQCTAIGYIHLCREGGLSHYIFELFFVF